MDPIIDEKTNWSERDWCRKLDTPLTGRARPIVSRDPLKPVLMAAFKAATGATAVTQVEQLTAYAQPRRFRAHCFRKGQGWDGQGFYELELGSDRIAGVVKP